MRGDRWGKANTLFKVTHISPPNWPRKLIFSRDIELWIVYRLAEKEQFFLFKFLSIPLPALKSDGTKFSPKVILTQKYHAHWHFWLVVQIWSTLIGIELSKWFSVSRIWDGIIVIWLDKKWSRWFSITRKEFCWYCSLHLL